MLTLTLARSNTYDMTTKEQAFCGRCRLCHPYHIVIFAHSKPCHVNTENQQRFSYEVEKNSIMPGNTTLLHGMVLGATKKLHLSPS